MTAAAHAVAPHLWAVEDDALVAEIPPVIREYLRKIAKAELGRRMVMAVLQAAVILPLAIRFLDIDLDVVILGIVGASAVVTFSFGYILRWQDRRERQLLKIEVDHRRQHGKWRWER